MNIKNVLLVIFPLSLFGSLPKPDGHQMSKSRLHLEHTIVDTEDLKNKIKRHEERSTLNISEEEEEDLSELAAQIYFRDRNHPLREYIQVHLRKKIAEAKLKADTKDSYEALETLLDAKKTRGSSAMQVIMDTAHCNKEMASFLHKLVMDSIEDAFVERDNAIELKERHRFVLEKDLGRSKNQTRMAAWGNLITAVASAGVSVGITLAILLGKN